MIFHLYIHVGIAASGLWHVRQASSIWLWKERVGARGVEDFKSTSLLNIPLRFTGTELDFASEIVWRLPAGDAPEHR